MIERWFQLTHHGTTIRKEIIAGITTFAAMAYILAVNPAILGMSGMDKGALITATALASAIMTLAMATYLLPFEEKGKEGGCPNPLLLQRTMSFPSLQDSLPLLQKR